MSSLADSEKKCLLEIARRAIAAAVGQRAQSYADLPFTSASDFAVPGETSDEPLPNLQAAAGAFVTLHRGSRLRGCIGQLPGNDSLLQVVTHCARSAALDDPRFRPLTAEELPDVDIEISVLSPLEDITLADIVPGKHGLMVSHGAHRGVLLPQVATQFNWSAEKFLQETCVKAALSPDAWKSPETRIQAFTAEVFSESDQNLAQPIKQLAEKEPSRGSEL